MPQPTLALALLHSYVIRHVLSPDRWSYKHYSISNLDSVLEMSDLTRKRVFPKYSIQFDRKLAFFEQYSISNLDSILKMSDFIIKLIFPKNPDNSKRRLSLIVESRQTFSDFVTEQYLDSLYSFRIKVLDFQYMLRK